MDVKRGKELLDYDGLPAHDAHKTGTKRYFIHSFDAAD